MIIFYLINSNSKYNCSHYLEIPREKKKEQMKSNRINVCFLRKEKKEEKEMEEEGRGKIGKGGDKTPTRFDRIVKSEIWERGWR